MDISEFISTRVAPELKPLAAMGLLLERLDRLPRSATPTQYRDVVMKIQGMLEDAAPGSALEGVLHAFPAMAELYENLHYAHAGLCRSQQDAAVEAELAARALFAKSFTTG